MLMANATHPIVGRFGIPIWVLCLRIPKLIILFCVIVLCFVGVYVPSSSYFEIGIMFAFASKHLCQTLETTHRPSSAIVGSIENAHSA